MRYLMKVRHAALGEPFMGYDVGFVKQSFPSRASLIDELAARDENFRDLCDDFATADHVRLNLEQSSGPDRNERLAEYVELVNSLRDEIETALDNAAVVPFPRPRR
jgi:uncharacterized protein YdcH (DUF465 family)